MAPHFPHYLLFAIREDDDEELHIDGVGFIVNGVQSMEEGKKREKAASLIPTSLSLPPSLNLSPPLSSLSFHYCSSPHPSRAV